MHVDSVWWELKDADIYALGYDYDRVDWRERNKLRKLRRIAMGEAKKLALRCGTFPSAQKGKNNLDPSMILNKTEVWVKDPNGGFSQALFTRENDDFIVTIPQSLDLNGRYLVSSHIEAGEMEMGFRGEVAKAHLYAKSFVVHSRSDGISGGKQGVFFDAPDKIPLEIGPLILRPEVSYAGTFQTRNHEYEMKVAYRGKPLPNAGVTVMTEGGWQKTLSTDSQGRLLVTPIESSGESRYCEKYLYVIAHYDAVRKEFHCASLTMPVYRARHEWRSMSGGFVLWAVLGGALIIVAIVGVVYRKKQRDRATMVMFENYRIKKG
ncbi:MAG: hypothetical protein Q7J27_09385 [Syntrophales bacterium]|nr:hypothetical protein [Syntrophales bacterium]